MRCPKCGFISFDHLETCNKCHKYLGDAVPEVNGTAYDAAAPLFLTVTAPEEADPLSAQQTEGQETYSMTTDEMMTATEETSASGQENAQEIEQYEEIEFAGFDDELGIEEEQEQTANTSASEEFVYGEEEPAEEETQDASSAMDFGDLDISDLAPPAPEQAEPIRFEPPPVQSDLEPVAARSPIPSSAPQPSVTSGQSALEDLDTNGLNLDAPARLVSGSAAGKRFLPSVKTGTALDKFDIDLGELFTDNKK